MTSVFRMMQAPGPGPNLGWIRKNAIEDSIEFFYMILLWASNLETFTTWLAATRSSEAYFYRKNLYEGSYAGPYEGSNVGLNEIPNEDPNKNCDIIALKVKCVMVLGSFVFWSKG